MSCVKPAAGSTERLRVLAAIVLGPLLVHAALLIMAGQGGSSYEQASPDLSARPDYQTWYFQAQVHSYLMGLLMYLVGGCGWLWLVLRYVARVRIRGLVLRPASIGVDALQGLLLLLGLIFVTDRLSWFIAPLFEYYSTYEVDSSMASSAQSPVLLGLQIAYSWLAGGVFEEFLRVSLLYLMWKLDQRPLWVLASILFTALFFGYCHIYQGSDGVINATLHGMLFGAFYAIWGRPLAMILGHGAYDTYAILYWMIWPPSADA